MTHESNYLSAKKPTNVLDLTRGCTENNYTHIIGEGLVHILRSNTALYFGWKQILSGRGRNCFILKFNVVNLTFPYHEVIYFSDQTLILKTYNSFVQHVIKGVFDNLLLLPPPHQCSPSPCHHKISQVNRY